MSDHRDLERKSSAVTLSDMEVFIFPELMYALVLANIMSPRLWRWRDDPWFAGLDALKPYRRITRLKQYIMDHYAFNLDLDTWGLTTKERELARFAGFIGADALAQSNALFGYEGDRYYFDIGIRRHFGLDRYDGSVIPYWKTETVEAMDAFRFKAGYSSGAGECVSLATLYAAALFVVAGIPLRDIFLMATPLHSQNFVDVDDGILTNNRRLVTKTMWFNGTALSAQARRALENERVTVVAHATGWMHTLYEQATIDAGAYTRFADKLRRFLKAPLTAELLGNYLRHNHAIQRCFQVRCSHGAADCFVALETVFDYEHGSSYSLTDQTRAKLLAEVEREEFQPAPLPGRIILDDLEAFVRAHRIDMDRPADVARLQAAFVCDCLNARTAIEALRGFCHTAPRLPDPAQKRFAAEPEPLGVELGMRREDVIRRLETLRGRNDFADLAFYAYRDLNRTEAAPFLRAAIQRNPVCLAAAKDMALEAVTEKIGALPDGSIYDEPGRLAQPDEVWNFGRGDGAEKALLLAAVLRARMPEEEIRIDATPTRAVLVAQSISHEFPSQKRLRDQTWEIPIALA